MPQDSIADPTKPSAGRMYDYFLGGSHNFEVDRQAANQILQMVPFIAKAMRLQRWPLQDIAEELSGHRGYDVIIDFASGLPTNDHLHQKVRPGTTVIYSDYDPVVVEYARDILRDVPNAYFFESDARQPESLLNRPEVQELLAGRKKVAFVVWGVSAFLEDENITHLAKYLYDWSSPDSCLVFNAQGAEVNTEDPEMVRAMNIYAKTGSPLHARSLAQYRQLLEPWKLEGADFIPLLEWNGFSQSELSKEDVKTFGPMGGGYGAYLHK